jgi:autotransporter family porin
LQAIYSYVDLDSSDDVGANIRFKDVDSLIGRLGVRIAKDWEHRGRGQERAAHQRVDSSWCVA